MQIYQTLAYRKNVAAADSGPPEVLADEQENYAALQSFGITTNASSTAVDLIVQYTTEGGDPGLTLRFWWFNPIAKVWYREPAEDKSFDAPGNYGVRIPARDTALFVEVAAIDAPDGAVTLHSKLVMTRYH